MKSKLAVFDFDNTVKIPPKKFFGANLFPDKEIPQEIFKILETEGWDTFRTNLIVAINDLNKSREEVENELGSSGKVMTGMKEVFEKLIVDHDIIIVSDAHTVCIEAFLRHNQMLGYVEQIYGIPSSISDDGKIQWTDVPNSYGGPCKKGGRNVCKGSALKEFCHDKKYDQIKYIGDGMNDLCPATRLQSSDQVFPRIGKPLHDILQKESIYAQVFPWENGIQILKAIS